MAVVLRQVLLLAVAALLTWWVVFFESEPQAAAPVATPDELQVAVAALAQRPIETPPAEPPPSPVEEPPTAESEIQAAPPPPETGDPDGVPDEEAPQTQPEEEAEAEEQPLEPTQAVDEEPLPAEPIERSAAALMRDAELLEAAHDEIDGEVRRGFATVLVAAPEDQLDIARAFGEELVLVPRAALDPDAEMTRWFRLDLTGTPRVESVVGTPDLGRYRQYRDLFEYEYARLPKPLRELRRSVLARSEIYLFAALIPPAEWAVVIGRRRAALSSAGRDASEVRRYVLRTIRTQGGAFDVRVEEITFTDGTRFEPDEIQRQP